jgi:predicted AlkP superfamily phosphohydrolase/phosphomutase
MPARPYDKVMCIGLDGATFDVIDPLLKRGRLPTLSRLLETGTRAELRSTVPPLSAPAWVSFMTGMNPGRHGVFHFRSMSRGALGSDLVGSWTYRGRTIFDHASRNDLRVIAFRVPMTYPPWPVNGVMVSGFPTPDPRTNFAAPPEVGERMPPLVKLAPLKSMMAGVEAQIDNFEYFLERSTEALVRMLREEEFDLFCYVNSITDWAAHKFWRYSDPSAPGYEPHPMGEATLLEHFYERADESLGRLLDAVSDPALVIVMSDHGTGPRSPYRFNTNAWLAELGLLTRRNGRPGRGLAAAALQWGKDVVPKKYWLWQHAPKAVRATAQRVQAGGDAIEWSRSQAYGVAIDHHVEGVNVNLAGRERFGCVPESAYDAVRQRVIEASTELVDPVTGAPVIRAAHRREDLYSGAHADAAPDLVLELNEAREAGHAPGQRSLSKVDAPRRERSSATHRPDGILVMNGRGVRNGHDLGRAHLLDVPATVLWALGLELPHDMDGSVLADAFGAELDARSARRAEAGAVEGSEDDGYTREEEEQMTEHLKDLGYV